MLLTKTVMVKWTSKTKKHYLNKGYTYTKMGNEFKINVEDLTDGSAILVNVNCDGENCTTPITKPIRWLDYKKCVKENDKYYCHNCSMKLFGNTNIKKTKLKNSKSFGYWLIKNLSLREAVDIIGRWDEKLNKCDIRDISYGSKGFNKKGYYFKCSKKIHSSELKDINTFVSNFNKHGFSNVLDCTTCNSFAQYGYDNISNDFLNLYWDWDKNDELGIDPWKVSYGSNKKVWIKCIEKSYHDSYLVTCYNFCIQNSRCLYCTNHNGKVHPLDSLGWLYPQVFNIWSSKNKKSSYDYSPNSGQYVWWKCLDGKHDDYKRKISDSQLCNFRCPKCVYERDESIIEEKTRLYLESLNYNVLHENKCTLVPINPRTNHIMPFDNEIKLINEKHLICEVMGIQHYELNGWHKNKSKHNNTTSEYELHIQQVRDRYKKFISYINGYEYLELPYWVFDEKDTYKKLINNKINKILSNIYKN